jgi:phenylalanyl-tRNA synthetase beta chain
MKFSLNWLKELIPITWSIPELTERLTMAGVEVEGIHTQGQGLDKVVVAQILKSEQHPNADRLSVCEVDAGTEKKQIVCGAKNYKVGDKIPLAVSGAKLPNGMEIKRSKLRGVESDGMMCSAKELGLAEDAEGLLILDPNLKVGQPFTEALNLDDTILDLEITPNRPDLLSHWGLAREIAALANLPAPNPEKLLSKETAAKLSQGSGSPFKVEVQNPDLCPRYTARIIRGVKVGPSPAWLKKKMDVLGHRSISNVVDITNYILEEIGQPLHAFDLKLLQDQAIIVRTAKDGEQMVRLDDETSKLQSEMLVIADSKRSVAIAGVMGGKETGVSESTVDILLESATFQPSSIRKTSKRLTVSSDSSYRFERGVDVELAGWASLRATSLILEVCGGTVEGALVDVRKPALTKPKILCRYQRVNQVLGTQISADEINSILKRLDCVLSNSTSNSSEVQPPTYRPDLEREVDLIEEVARVYGIGKIPGRIAPSPVSSTRDDPSALFIQKLQTTLTGLGLDEACSYTVVSSHQLAKTRAAAQIDPLILANPLSSEMDTLRPTLLTGLLEIANRNFAGGAESVALFEIGKTFHAEANTTGEKLSLGIILCGTRRQGARWEKRGTYDFYDLKGVVDSLLAASGNPESSRTEMKSEISEMEPGLTFIFSQKNKIVGYAGRVKSSLAQAHKIPTEVLFAEVDVDWLMKRENRIPKYQPWSIYPAIRRDIAMTLSRGEKYEGIVSILQSLAKKHAENRGIFLQEVQLFDIFQSDKIGADKKSLAYSLTYRSPQRTLTDSEVNAVHDSIKKELTKQVSCELRE